MKNNIPQIIRYLKINTIYKALKQYERVIYLDVSCLVNKNTPNLFKIVPQNEIGGVEDGGIGRGHLMTVSDLVRGCKLTYNKINTGLLVLSKQHMNLFNINYKCINYATKGLTDQRLINTIIAQSWKDNSNILDQYYLPDIRKEIKNIKMFKLDNKFNFVGSQIKKQWRDIVNHSEEYFILHFTRCVNFKDYKNILDKFN